MAKITISDLSSGFASIDALNAAFQDLEDELNNKVLYRDNPEGEANQMKNDLDMNGYRILNARATTGGDNFIWMGAWETGTSYSVNNLVYEAGTTYICIVDHISGVFADDLTAEYWDIFALQGAAGAGAGDLLAANNLSELTATASTTRANIFAAKSGSNSDITALTGLTTPLAVNKGGTGRNNLTANYVLLGNGTSDVQMIAPGTSGNVLTSNGTTWASTTPTGVFTKLSSTLISATFDNYTSNKSYSVAHGLGVVPKGFSIRLRCVSTDINYSVNDEIDISGLMQAYYVVQGGCTWCNKTHIGFTTAGIFSNSIMTTLPNKTTGVMGSAKANKWKIVIRAWA